MDLPCVNCGEPWDTDTVLHESPDEFERIGCKITRCPACAERRPQLTKADREQLDVYAAMADLNGDDIDGFAVHYEDGMYNLPAED